MAVWKNAWVRARVLEVSDRAYLDGILPFLNRARKEIVASLYLMEPHDEAGPRHPVNRLMEALLAARKRGVRIRIYLNTRFDVRDKAQVARGKYFEKLLESGVEIFSLLPGRRLHDKLIVIDARYVVEGSTNWSVSALESNYESDSIIDSPLHARKKLERIARMTLPNVPRPKDIETPLLPVPETVTFPFGLFEKTKLPRMVARSERRSMALYFLLMGQAEISNQREFEMDLETAARSLGLPPDWDRSRLRRQMIKVLRKLSERYPLIEVEIRFGRNAKGRLRPVEGVKVPVPGWIFSPNFLSKASLPEAYLALVGEILKNEGVAIDTLSAPEIEKRFGIGRSTVVWARAQKKKQFPGLSG